MIASLDEAIKAAEGMSEAFKKKSEEPCSTLQELFEKNILQNVIYAQQYKMLADWLKELKAYRETYPYGVERSK